MSLHDSKQVPSWMEVHHQVEALWILGEGGGGVVRETPFYHSGNQGEHSLVPRAKSLDKTSGNQNSSPPPPTTESNSQN